MTLEDKFMSLLEHSSGPFILMVRANDGYVKIEYRSSWDDGLSNRSLVRIINPKLGLSTAPRDFDHMLRSMILSGVVESDFEDALDRRVESGILNNHEKLKLYRTNYGDDYVTDLIETKGGRSFNERLADLFKSVIGKRKPPAPTLTIVKDET